MSRKYAVMLTSFVEVEVDETKFTPEFLAEYAQSFSHKPEIEDHVRHLAWVHATGVENLDWNAPEFAPFVEGYGPVNEMGIKARTIDNTETDIVDRPDQ